ncbi:hypothetical protein ACIA47_23625 [Micromonospora sp. NPDC051227]|uniref:hypothetical protein n=1 Tax=Micromonospora sp. NPDC051227 TaxID=3364285 RepID=UPI0037B38461
MQPKFVFDAVAGEEIGRGGSEPFVGVLPEGRPASIGVDIGAMLRERNGWNDVLRLSAYGLTFFDVEKHEKLCVMMDRVASAELSPSEPGAVGRRWLRSIDEVAWRLYMMAESQRPHTRE